MTFQYDHAQRLVGEQQRHAGIEGGSGWQWQQHTLTANGAPQASQFGDLPALNWHTYGSGHLHGLSAPELNLEIDLTPDALHRETQRRVSLGNGDQTQPLILERGYTNLGQLDHLTLRGAQNGGGQQYQYDALGRMSFRSVQSDQASSVIAYSYDAAGNRLEGQRAITDNRLDHLDGARHRFDGAGNMIEKQTANGDRLTLGYDGANRLIQLTRASERGRTVDATYRYDGLGRRISKTVRHENGTTATTHYGWDGDRIVREASENQGSTIVYEPGSFVPMLRIDDTQEGPQLSAFVTDAIGTPMQLVAANGETQWQGQPDDWAAVKNARGSARQPIRFQGQWQDEESGLYYNRHRYYDPQQGRYVSQDPIGLRGGTNLYGYVTNPIGAVDPMGLAGCYVHFPDYPISTGLGFSSTMLGGHSGVLGYNSEGETQYYEYGRYAADQNGVIGVALPGNGGNVRRVDMPDLTISSDGSPTNTSLEVLREALSERAGRGTHAEMTCYSGLDENQVYSHIDSIANNPEREEYDWKPWSANHCRTFAKESIEAGR